MMHHTRRRTAVRLATAVPAVALFCVVPVLANPQMPVITGSTYNVATQYGAVGNDSTVDTSDLQSAINAASNAGGGTVLVPAGTYLTGPLTLKSNVNLDLASGAELEALPYGTYPSDTTSLLTANNLTNFEITGSGTIDGQGSGWWNIASTRPNLISISNSSVFAMSGVTLSNSPQEHLQFDGTSNVTINGITVSAPASSPNTDGIDPSGSHYLIENCHISDGDDDIAVKPQNTFCSDITITGCTIGAGHGISVGGETNDGLNGMTVSNCTFTNTTDGLRLKAGRGNGGLVQNVTYSNITMTGVTNPIVLTSYYLNGSDTAPSNPASDPGQAITSTTPIWQNIAYDNVTATGSSNAGEIYGLPEEPVQGISFQGVTIAANTGMELNHAHDVDLSGLTIVASRGSEFTSYYDVTLAPEPGTVAMAGLALAGVLCQRRRR